MSYDFVVVATPDDWDAYHHIRRTELYERMGFVRESWNPAELTGIAADCVQMTKAL